MRASLAATDAAMDRVSAAAAAAERTLDAAARRAAASPTRPSGVPASPLPPRVPLPELRPLDAILGALGEQVDALDAAAAIAARAATEGTSSSSGLSVDGSALRGGPTAPSDTTEAMYAAAAAAANNSAPPSSTTFGEVSTLGDAATPGASAADVTRSDASPRDDAGAPALTPASERDTPYDVRPQRDVAGALRFDPRVVSSPAAISAVAAKIAAAAVADAAPGESPEATARRVAAGMAAALDPTHLAPGSPALWDGGDDNPDSSWARALGALDDEWAASVRLAETDAAANASRLGRFASPTRRFASPSRYAGVASADDDDDFAAAEAEARALADAEKETPTETPARVLDGVAVPTRAASFAPPMRVFAEDDAASVGTASLAFDASLSLDGRSLAALANALDARSFDARSESEAEEEDAFGSETRDAEPAPAKSETKRRGAKTGRHKDAATRTKAPRAPRSMGSLLGKPSVAFVPAEPARGAEEGPNDADADAAARAEAEATARRKAEAAALRKKAAAFDRKNRANLRDAATKKR